MTGLKTNVKIKYLLTRPLTWSFLRDLIGKECCDFACGSSDQNRFHHKEQVQAAEASPCNLAPVEGTGPAHRDIAIVQPRLQIVRSGWHVKLFAMFQQRSSFCRAHHRMLG